MKFKARQRLIDDSAFLRFDFVSRPTRLSPTDNSHRSLYAIFINLHSHLACANAKSFPWREGAGDEGEAGWMVAEAGI